MGHTKLSKVLSGKALSRLHFLSSTCSYNAPFHKLYKREKIRELLSIFDILRNDLGFFNIHVFFVAQKPTSSNRDEP